jgi:hypothetical protein
VLVKLAIENRWITVGARPGFVGRRSLPDVQWSDWL